MLFGCSICFTVDITHTHTHTHTLTDIPTTLYILRLVAGPRPNPPTNLSVWQTNDGLNIQWKAAIPSPAVSVHEYLIEYRTVGQWVPLGEPHPADTRNYTWETVSRGAEYKFRLRSISPTGARSEPTRVVTFETKGTTYQPCPFDTC